jgi:hypothetical protein
LTPWRLLGRQPADCAALGIPLKSSPRHFASFSLIEGQKQKQNNMGKTKNKISPFLFCFCPIEGKNNILPEMVEQKQNVII